MVEDDVAVVGELLVANTADAVLSRTFAVEQLAHCAVRAQFPVSTRMMPIREI